jgi:hypothetical protein
VKIVKTPNGKEVECFIPSILVGRYCVTLSYGGMTCLVSQPTSDAAAAYKAFNEHIPNVGKKGPRPILRLWALREEKQFIPKKGGG